MSHWLHLFDRSLHMRPQIACLRWCIITLVAFVSLFSSVRFQMSPHMAFLRWFIVALATFVWLFSTVAFKMSPEMAFRRSSIVIWLHFFHFFKCVLKVLLNLSIWMNFRRKNPKWALTPLAFPDIYAQRKKATCNNFWPEMTLPYFESRKKSIFCLKRSTEKKW